MKKRKLCLIFIIPLLFICSCSNNARDINKEIDMYINDAEFKTFNDSNDEYTVFIRLDNGKNVLLYENLFGSSKENNFLIQYDYDYLYASPTDLSELVKDNIYNSIKLKYDSIKEYYPDLKDNYSTLYTDGTKITKQLEINNTRNEDVSIVVIDTYIPFSIRYHDSGKIYYFAIPYQTQEYKKVNDNLIIDEGNIVNFNSFIEENNIKHK